MDIEIYRKFFGSIAKPQRSGKVFSNCESVPPIDGDTVTNRYPLQSGHEGLSEMLTPEAVKGVKRIHTTSLNMELLKKLRTPIQSPDMAEAKSSSDHNPIMTPDEGVIKAVNQIHTLDESITGTADIAEKSSKDTKRIRTVDENITEPTDVTAIRLPPDFDDDDEKGLNKTQTPSDDEKDTHKVSTPDGMQDSTVGISYGTSDEADRATRAEGGEGQQRYIRQQGESLKNYLHRTRTDIFLFLREALKPTYLTPAQEMKIVEELREAYQVMWQGQRVPRNGKYLIKSECERVNSALDGAITKPKYQTQQKHRCELHDYDFLTE